MSENPTQKAIRRLSETKTAVITRGQLTYVSWYVDVLIYTIVLNLFAQYSEHVYIETFTISILTALLLKLLLVLVEGIEERVQHYFEQKAGTAWKILGLVVIFGILIVGKLFILEVVNFVFGDQVELGHFVQVLVLILAMIVSRELANWVFHWLGRGVDESDVV